MIRAAFSVWLPPVPCYLRVVKLILFSVLAIACSLISGCTSGKKGKSGFRNYDGDSSPNIRMFEEKPGYPVNTR